MTACIQYSVFYCLFLCFFCVFSDSKVCHCFLLLCMCSSYNYASQFFGMSQTKQFDFEKLATSVWKHMIDVFRITHQNLKIPFEFFLELVSKFFSLTWV